MVHSHGKGPWRRHSAAFVCSASPGRQRWASTDRQVAEIGGQVQRRCVQEAGLIADWVRLLRSPRSGGRSRPCCRASTGWRTVLKCPAVVQRFALLAAQRRVPATMVSRPWLQPSTRNTSSGIERMPNWGRSGVVKSPVEVEPTSGSGFKSERQVSVRCWAKVREQRPGCQPISTISVLRNTVFQALWLTCNRRAATWQRCSRQPAAGALL